MHAQKHQDAYTLSYLERTPVNIHTEMQFSSCGCLAMRDAASCDEMWHVPSDSIIRTYWSSACQTAGCLFVLLSRRHMAKTQCHHQRVTRTHTARYRCISYLGLLWFVDKCADDCESLKAVQKSLLCVFSNIQYVHLVVPGWVDSFQSHMKLLF